MIRKPVTGMPALVLAALLTTITNANAQPYIEVGFTGIAAGSADSTQMTVRCVFDTSVQGTTLGGLTCFEAVSGTSTVDMSVDPFDTQDPYTNEETVRLLTAATLTYAPASDSYIISTTDEHGDLVSINVTKLRDGFSASTRSLPSDPQDFLPDTAQSEARVAIISTPTYFISGWDAASNAFTGSGTFRFWAQTLEELPASACPVDLNGDQVYDFADVSTFLTLFAQGCP